MGKRGSRPQCQVILPEVKRDANSKSVTRCKIYLDSEGNCPEHRKQK